jgi:hypothetical protein
MIEPGLEKLAKHRRTEQEKMGLMREVAELFKMDWAGQKKRVVNRPKECHLKGLTPAPFYSFPPPP